MSIGRLAGTLAALAAVLALIWLAQRLARPRLAPRRSGQRRLQLAETLALDARRRVHLIGCDGAWLLLETGGSQDLVIGWVGGRPPS